MEEIPAAAPVGHSGRRCRALAFAGGGFDTATQLGVAHALLVARGAAPDYVAGISAGAVNAAALAEILQAGQDLPAAERWEAQVVTLRRFLTSYEELPADLVRSIFPDTFEINAAKPMKPVELPIHFDRERQGRDTANQARAGLIRLLNRLCEVRLPVRAIGLIANRVLHCVAATEEASWGRRLWTRSWTLGSLWLTGFRYADGLGPLAGALAWAALTGAPREVAGPGTKAATLIGGRRTLRLAFRGLRDLLDVLLFALGWTVLAPVALLVLAGIFLRPGSRRRSTLGRRLGDRILQHYGLADGLGNSYVLKEQLIRCFDPAYYGTPDIARVLEQALGREKTPAPAEKSRKTLASYRLREPRIVVAPIAADVASGDLRVLPGDIPVVDALLAATATVPLFPAVKVASRRFRDDGLSERIFVDGLNISNEPIGALLELLRQEDDPHQPVAAAAIVDVYTVSGSADAGTSADCSRLLEVALRAYQLRRRRDATMEERYSDLYTRALPGDTGRARITIDDKTYVRAAVWPLRLDRPTAINREVLAGHADVGLKGLIEEAVADGCRAALEAMIPRAVAAAVRIPKGSVPCWKAVRQRLGEDYDGLLRDPRQDGPGLPEICARCALHREPSFQATPAADRAVRQRLRLRPEPQGPEWPREGEAPDAPFAETPRLERPILTLADWPPERAGLPGRERPLVNFLFGGGVFRGVFHMGVLNGLNELGLMPDLVAGSSVGSIVAAMIAQVFTRPRAERQGAIADLSATFLSIDQLVMTDRLSDFVRGLTLRAADADFSARDLDLALRRYDLEPRSYGGRARRVAAGLERLFYLNPIELLEVVKAAREQDYRRLSELVQTSLQRFLDRSGVGREILGAEPLALLIHQEVIQPLHPGASDETFAAFARHGIQFLATATNLQRGELEILGYPAEQDQTSLLYGLLASSAFPAVFRPRQRWEILRRDKGTDLFVDGGIIDNLPLDAAARFLDQASRAEPPLPPNVARRPRVNGKEVPHLLFTASLEVDKTALGDGGAEEVRKSFLRLQKRATTFGYNRKIDAYQTLQRDLREIYHSRLRHGESPGWTPLDLHVLAVRPRWLCSTFGFHPMLRFRRQKQAESIAHGCASTIAAFHHDAQQNGTAAWMEAWGVHGLHAVDPKAVTSHFDATQPALNPQRSGKEGGQCWFRDARCPFSREALAANPDLEGRTALLEELPKIHQACGRPETHRPAHAVQNEVE